MMRNVPRAVKARDADSQDRPDTGQSGQSERAAPRAVIQLGNDRADPNVEDDAIAKDAQDKANRLWRVQENIVSHFGERAPPGVKGEKHIHGSVRPAGCSEEAWQREQDRRKRQAEHDRQKHQSMSQGKSSAARLTPAAPAVPAESNTAQLTPANPSVTAARARAAARVDRQRNDPRAAERGSGKSDRATPYWRERDKGGRKP